MKTASDLAIENILRHIDDTGISQAALARKAKVGPITLNRILKKKKGLGKKVAAQVAKAMGVTIGQLYSEPSDSQPASVVAEDRASLIGEINVMLVGMSEAEIRALRNVIRDRQPQVASGKVSK